ncbi:MAG TPA: T9SS type A sorting domain-containing protein, partial [Paludibacter sp.]|nr:T9SS type A sorting domain-containing protein [Paludibacter sp.]
GGTVALAKTIMLSVANSGTLRGTGSIRGNVTLSSNSSTIPGNTNIGTLTFGGNVSMNSTATLAMQIAGGSSSCDKLAITGTFTCNGTLNVTLLSGTLVSGAVYQLFTAGTTSGTFAAVNLPTLDAGLEWDLSELYTAGKIKVIPSTGVESLKIRTGVIQNPTNGIFNVYIENAAAASDVVVTDLQGRTVYKSTVSDANDKFRIDLFNQPDGVYLLKVSSENESSNILKLIKASNIRK